MQSMFISKSTAKKWSYSSNIYLLIWIFIQLCFARLFSLSQFPLSIRIKPRKPCDIRRLRGFSCFRGNSLSHAFSYVLCVLFPLVKMGISLTATTVLGIFATKGKIAFCASGYRWPWTRFALFWRSPPKPGRFRNIWGSAFRWRRKIFHRKNGRKR